MKVLVILTRRPDADAGQLARLSRTELLAVWKGMAEGAVRAVHGLQEGAGLCRIAANPQCERGTGTRP